jgi:serine/threonine protein kinase
MNVEPSLMEVAREFVNLNNLSEIIFVGKGAFKETYRVTNESGEYRALKIVDPEKCDAQRSEREINALKKCDDLLIGKLYDHGEFRTSSNMKYLYFMEEYLEGGTLTDRIKNKTLTPQIVRKYAISLVKALDYLKRIHLVHRDIKPDNIMFRKNSSIPVLVDFGLVRDLSQSSLTQTWWPHGPGTPYYAAPEQLNNEKYLIKWRTDQFSLGIVLGICLTGEHPFREPGMTDSELINAVAQRRRCTREFRSKISELGFEGIIKMIEPWPVRRYASPGELLAYFQNKE